MVLTPLHYPQAYITYVVSRRKLSYLGLLFGSFVPDIEIPFIIYFNLYPPNNRFVLHSFFGATFISPVLGVMFYMSLKLLMKLFRRRNKCLDEKISIYALSVSLGALMHVTVDALHHRYLPLLWPFTRKSIDALVLGDVSTVSKYLHILFLILTIASITHMLITLKPTNMYELLTC